MKTVELKKEAFYPHPPEQVWAALTNGEALAQWLMPNNFRAELGATFRFHVDFMPGKPHITECEILAFEPPRRMVWSWTILSPSKRKAPAKMQIEWLLAPGDGGTHLVLRQTGAEQIGLIHRLMMSMGWGTMLKRWLPRALGAFEKGDGGWIYRRLVPAPNRGHHGVKSVPAGYFK